MHSGRRVRGRAFVRIQHDDRVRTVIVVSQHRGANFACGGIVSGRRHMPRDMASDPIALPGRQCLNRMARSRAESSQSSPLQPRDQQFTRSVYPNDGRPARSRAYVRRKLPADVATQPRAQPRGFGARSDAGFRQDRDVIVARTRLPLRTFAPAGGARAAAAPRHSSHCRRLRMRAICRSRVPQMS